MYVNPQAQMYFQTTTTNPYITPTTMPSMPMPTLLQPASMQTNLQFIKQPATI